MAFEPTEIREFDVLQVGLLQRTDKENPFIECETSLGTVAFWVVAQLDNFGAIQSRTPPFRIRSVRPPNAKLPNTLASLVPSRRLRVHCSRLTRCQGTSSLDNNRWH